MRLFIVFGSSLIVDEPSHRIIAMQVFRVRGKEFQRLEPESGYAFWRVVEVDIEPICLVVVLHVAKNVVVHVTEELDFWLNAPVVFCVCEGRVVVEHARIPAAHLMVGDHVRVLDVVFFENLGRLFEEVH